MHINSISTYYEEKKNLNKRAKHIYNYLCSKKNEPLTDRDVQRDLGYAEPNNVRPRITELIKIGLVEEVGKKKCSLTGKRVRLIEAKID